MIRETFFNQWEAVQRELGYSQAVKVGGMVYIAGTAAVDPEFKPVCPNDFESQLQFVYDRLGETLAHFSLGFSDVVREVIYVTHMAGLVGAMPLRKTFYGDGPYPAATAVEVKQLLFPELMIEIELVAACRTSEAE